MVTDGGGEILEVAAGAALIAAPGRIGPAALPGDLVKGQCAEEGQKTLGPLYCFLWARLAGGNVPQVDCDHVRDRDCADRPLPASGRIFGCDVIGELDFSARTSFRAESSANVTSAVSNEPSGGGGNGAVLASPSWPKIEAGAFVWPWHDLNQLSTSSGVVNTRRPTL
jgi:hypothetical protein